MRWPGYVLVNHLALRSNIQDIRIVHEMLLTRRKHQRKGHERSSVQEILDVLGIHRGKECAQRTRLVNRRHCGLSFPASCVRLPKTFLTTSRSSWMATA